MKLYTKLILSLVASIVIVVAGSQFFQNRKVIRQIEVFSHTNLEILKEREEASAKNLFQALERGIAGSLERGEMEKFSRLLAAQRDVEGLIEFSLLDQEGIVTNSTDDKFLDTQFPEDLRDRLIDNPEMQLNWDESAVHIYQPLISNGDCVRCHTNWTVGENAGFMHFRFSKDALNKAEQQSVTTLATLNKSTVKNAVLAIFSIAAVLLIVSHFLLKVFVSSPLTEISNRVKDIAEGEGDLTARIEVKSTDEIGHLAKSFNRFIEKLQAMIKEIAGNAVTLRDSSASLNDISGSMSEEAGRMFDQSNTVAAAAEEMSANVNSVAATMEQASTNVSMVASSTEEMSATINDIVKNTGEARQITKEAVDQAKTASGIMDELGRSANEIEEVTDSITEISEQTNLLALNATIEAARAGEAGKGFAVVATEIKTLARQAAEATDKIKQRNQGIQDSTQNAIKEISQVSDIITNVDTIVSTIAAAVEEQSTTTQEISNNVAQTHSGIQEITTNVAQSSTVSADIAKEIAGVNQAANEITSSNTQVNDSAKELSRLARQLTDLVDRFTV